MIRDDPHDQLRSDISVPHEVRVNHEHGAAPAHEEAVTARLSDGIGAIVETVILEPAGHQLKEGLRLSVDRTARPGADEQVMPKSSYFVALVRRGAIDHRYAGVFQPEQHRHLASVVDLVIDDEGDDLDDEQREALDAAIAKSIEQAAAGQVAPADEVLVRLRARRRR